MLSKGQFHAGLDKAEEVLRHAGLLLERNVYERRRLGAAELSGLDYPSTWEALYASNDYDLRLKDGALMQFWRSEAGDGLYYSWYESPHDLLPFDEYARAYIAKLLEEEDTDLIDEFIGGCQWEIREAYEEDRRTAMLRNAVTPFRYEYKPSQYRAGVHPASHLHVGIENEIRFGCRRILTPISFVLLVLRQAYKTVWTMMLASGVVVVHASHVREKLQLVGKEFWCGDDELEMCLE
ncbi:MAG: DUF2290 domain-containing protein [Planctomycetaceae bacterium]